MLTYKRFLFGSYGLSEIGVSMFGEVILVILVNVLSRAQAKRLVPIIMFQIRNFSL
jgi:hypothetical protein